MPLTRYQIRNEYGLADPELYKAADRDDPEALLEGVAMAGLVGVLRQLGDLAEFAAEIFHDLHEEVMATATRRHGLMVRVQQLEADFPTIEKALLSQTNHSSFFSNSGFDWHPNLRSEQNLITRGDLPRFVMDSYEECRGPPRLFLLDKFDVAGAGACLKRYTDPSFFKAESACSLASADMQRGRKLRKVKHKKGSHWRNGETSEVLLPSHAKLHELFLEERIENGYSDPARRVKLKKRHLNGSAVDSRTRKSYMDKFVETLSPERKLICATSVTSSPLNLSSDNNNESGLRILDISIVSPAEKFLGRGSASSLTNEQEVVSKDLMVILNGGSFDGEIVKGSEQNSDGESDNSYSNLQMVAVEKELEVDGKDKTEGSVEGYSSDDLPSEVDNYVDALATMESELDTDNESRAKSNLRLMKVDKCRTVSDANEEEHVELQVQSLDSQSNENYSTSENWNNSSERGRASLNSDTLSNLVKNTPSECDAAAKELPSIENCGSGTCIEEGVIPDRGDISGNKLVREMSPTQEHPDLGANSPVVSYVGPLLDETSSDKIKVCSESFDIKENVTNLDLFMAVVHDDSSQAKDEFTSASPTLPLVEADEEILCATSDNLLHLKNVEELASVNNSGNDSVNEVFQAKRADEDAVGIFTSEKTGSPQLSIPSTEEQLFPASIKDVQTPLGTTLRPHSSDVAKPVNRVSQVNDPVRPTAFKSGVIPWRRISRESYPEGDAPETHVLKEQKDESQTHLLWEHKDVPQTHVLVDQKISDLDEDMSDSKEKFNIEKRSRTLDDEGVSLFTCNVDSEGGDSTSKEIPSNPPTHSGHGDHVLSANIDHATVHVDDVAASSVAVVKNDYINDFIDTSPGTTNVDAEEGHSVSLELPSNSPTYSGLGNLVISDNIVPETVHGEDLAVSSAVVVKDDDINDFIDSSPGTANVDAEEGDSVSLELPTNSLTYSGIENLLISDNIVPETVHGEDLAMRSASDAKSDVVNDIDTSLDALWFPPSNFMNLHESLPDSWDPHLKESEMDEAASPKSVPDSEGQKEVTAVVSPDSESDPSKSVAYDPSISELNDDAHNFSLNEQNELSVPVYGAPTSSTSLEMSNDGSQSQSLDQIRGEYPVSSSTSALPEADLREAETKLETSLELQANQVKMENLEIERASDQLEAALEQSPEFQSDQLGMEDSQDDQGSTSSLNSQQIGFPSQPDKEISNHIIQETCLDASSESLPENPPSQPSTSKFFTKSAGQETDILRQKLEPLEPVLPNLVQPPVVKLEDTPPLPPLPPMQWRLGNMQHTSLASDRDLGGVSNGSFLPMQSLQANEKAQFDLPVPQRELLQPQNPFLSLTSEDMKSQPIFEPLVGHVVSPAPYPQVPTDNDSYRQHNFPDLGGMQFSSPFISKVSGHNTIVLEGEKGLSSLEPFTVAGSESTTSSQDPVFSHREIVHPHQLMLETGLELEVLQQSLSNLELEQGRPLATSVTAPTTEDEQPQHSLSTTEGGQLQFTSKPLIVPGAECTSKHDSSFSHGEAIQSLQQLPQDSGLEPEDVCHSLRISEREQEKPLAASVTATITVDEKPPYSLSTSEGETAWSSNTSDIIPDSEIGKSNGTVNKILRPRNPLIDAVTAHGQSKLKKASERIQPQIEPKVDERDLFLQQIRTKSFNLKPATVTRSDPRPNIQGHNPNLKVISLLEKKAIAIRQAFAGSDEDDEDSWSDS